MEAWIQPALVLAAGFGASVINVLAGGGGLLTLPALVFLGLPADVANGTNRIGVLAQGIAATAGFRERGWPMPRWAGVLCVASAAAGAALATVADADATRVMAGALILLVLPFAFARPSSGRWPRWASSVALIAGGLHGGFVQAGVGVVLLFVFTRGFGLEIAQANRAKVLVVLVFTIPALAVFGAAGKVDVKVGLLLAAGSWVGGAVGARINDRVDPLVLRWFVAAAAVAAGASLLASGAARLGWTLV